MDLKCNNTCMLKYVTRDLMNSILIVCISRFNVYLVLHSSSDFLQQQKIHSKKCQ